MSIRGRVAKLERVAAAGGRTRPLRQKTPEEMTDAELVAEIGRQVPDLRAWTLRNREPLLAAPGGPELLAGLEAIFRDLPRGHDRDLGALWPLLEGAGLVGLFLDMNLQLASSSGGDEDSRD